MHDVTIRTATLADGGALASLAGELGYPATGEEMRPRIALLLARPDEHAVLVAARGEDVAGWIHVAVTHLLESGTKAEICGLVVTERERGGGIGAQLVAAGEAWARAQGTPLMRVRSNVVRERTHRFYERLGYVTRKTSKVFEKAL